MIRVVRPTAIPASPEACARRCCGASEMAQGMEAVNGRTSWHQLLGWHGTPRSYHVVTVRLPGSFWAGGHFAWRQESPLRSQKGSRMTQGPLCHLRRTTASEMLPGRLSPEDGPSVGLLLRQCSGANLVVRWPWKDKCRVTSLRSWGHGATVSLCRCVLVSLCAVEPSRWEAGVCAAGPHAAHHSHRLQPPPGPPPALVRSSTPLACSLYVLCTFTLCMYSTLCALVTHPPPPHGVL